MGTSRERFAQVREVCGGKLPAFTFPGGYTCIYLTRQGDVLCADCADTNLFGEDADKYSQDFDDPVIAYDTYDEGPPLCCDGCSRLIESSYGDPDQDDAGE